MIRMDVENKGSEKFKAVDGHYRMFCLDCEGLGVRPVGAETFAEAERSEVCPWCQGRGIWDAAE